MTSVGHLTKLALTGVVFTLLYALLVHVGFSLPPEGHDHPVVWLSGGTGILMLLMTSKRLWPLLTIGWLVAFQLRSDSLSWISQIMIGSTIGISCFFAVAFLERRKFNRALIEIRDVVLLLIATVIMAFVIAFVGMVTRFQQPDMILPWMMANLAGTVMIAPVVLAWRYGGPFGNMKRWLHFVSCIIATLTLCALAWLYGEELNLEPFHFLPILIWAALAFNVRGMALINLIVGGFTYLTTMKFGGADHAAFVSYTQQTIVFSGFTLLILSAVADHRKEIQRLADREQRLASIVNTAEDGIIVVDDETGIIDSMNPAAERMFGYSHGEAVGNFDTDLLFPVGRQSLHGAIDAGKPVVARRADGSEFSAQVTRASWTNIDGKIFNTKIVRDLTWVNKAAAELIDREERYRAIVETAVDGIIVIDSHGIIQSFNEAADKMFGFAIGEAIGQPVSILMSDEETSGIKSVLGTGGMVVQARRKDGSMFPAHLAVAEWFVSGERFYTGIMRDLTMQKASEEARDILAREVDHRAKNALAVVQSLVRLTRARNVTDFIDAVSGRIEALARAHSLLSQTNWSGVPLAQIAEDETAVAAKGSDVTITGSSVRMTPDAVQPLSMLFHELSTNAFKYGALRSPEGTVAIAWRIVNKRLVITWIEEGVEQITPPDSFGFGSRMMTQVVTKQLEGSIDHDWRERGLCVTVVLPAHTFKRGAVKKCSKPSSPSIAPQPGQGRRVLIVEDDALISMEMEAALEAGGYEVIGRATSVAEALETIQSVEIDVAVLDVDLGGEMSFPIADILMEKGIPYAFATGFETLTKERGYNAPALTKPVSEVTIRRTFDELLGNRDA